MRIEGVNKETITFGLRRKRGSDAIADGPRHASNLAISAYLEVNQWQIER